jgi:hypothetical protein
MKRLRWLAWPMVFAILFSCAWHGFGYVPKSDTRDAFLGNFLATILGLIFGLPLALWTNRKIMDIGAQEREDEQRQKIGMALDVVADSLTHNRTQLARLSQQVGEASAPFDPELDVSAWDVSKDTLTSPMVAPQLLQRIAYHFARLQTTVKLTEMYLSYVAGPVAVLGGCEATRDKLKGYIFANAKSLEQEASILIEGIKELRSPTH